MESNHIPALPSLCWAKQAKCFQSSLVRQALHSPHHTNSPSLCRFQHEFILQQDGPRWLCAALRVASPSARHSHQRPLHLHRCHPEAVDRSSRHGSAARVPAFPMPDCHRNEVTPAGELASCLPNEAVPAPLPGLPAPCLPLRLRAERSGAPAY